MSAQQAAVEAAQILLSHL